MTLNQIQELSRLEMEIAADSQALVGVKVTQDAVNAIKAKSDRLTALKRERDYIQRLEKADSRLASELTPETHRRLLEAGRRDRLIEADIDSRRKGGLTDAAREAKEQQLHW
jgi:hypothetical protein